MNSFDKEIKTTQIHTTMKNLKNILSIFAVLGIFATGVFAQETDVVAVTAEVQATITLATTDIALGTIQQAASVIDANSNDDATEANIGTTASPGSIQIDGTAGASITVSWTNATLDTSPASDAITFTPSVWNGSSELTTPGGSTETITGGSITLDVGGELAAPGGTGTYSTANGSPITFTVQYD
jgi:hypothetical protein